MILLNSEWGTTMTKATAAEPSPSEAVPLGNFPTRMELELEWLANLTPEDKEQARRELRAASRPPRPLPEGKSVSDMVCGTWPGDETDDEIARALERLS